MDDVQPSGTVAETAYALWQPEGCRDGRAAEYWRRAEEAHGAADKPTASIAAPGDGGAPSIAAPAPPPRSGTGSQPIAQEAPADHPAGHATSDPPAARESQAASALAIPSAPDGTLRSLASRHGELIANTIGLALQANRMMVEGASLAYAGALDLQKIWMRHP